MAKWERLVVYSLLFVSLYLGLKDYSADVLQAQTGVVQEIRTNRVVVVDKQGRDRIVLGTDMSDLRASVEILDLSGDPSVQLQVLGHGYGGNLLLTDRWGQVWLRGSGGAHGLYISDASGDTTAYLGKDPLGRGNTLFIRGGGRSSEVRLEARPDNTMGLYMGNKDGVRIALETTESGSSVNLFEPGTFLDY